MDIFNANPLVVRQPKRFMVDISDYEVYDAHGRPVAQVREQGADGGMQVLRALSRNTGGFDSEERSIQRAADAVSQRDERVMSDRLLHHGVQVGEADPEDLHPVQQWLHADGVASQAKMVPRVGGDQRRQ